MSAPAVIRTAAQARLRIERIVYDLATLAPGAFAEVAEIAESLSALSTWGHNLSAADRLARDHHEQVLAAAITDLVDAAGCVQ